MNGEIFPSTAYPEGSLWSIMTDNTGVVQFIHRTLAWVVASVLITIAWDRRTEPGVSVVWKWMLFGVLIQFSLGVIAVIYQVPLAIGVLHQLGALLLLATMIVAIHGNGSRIKATAA